MRSISWLLAGAAGMALASPALAQQAVTPGNTQGTDVADDDGGSDTIVVSGSRIDRAGFIAPSPTTVIGEQAIEDRATVNIADIINEVPSFRRTNAPEAGGIGNQAINSPDLRGLGATRTLVLLDRMRLPSVNFPGATVAGATDLNLIPSALISRIDVVTGGASAAYGSGAIAGVLNLQMNTRLEGLKGNVQYGETKYGDAEDWFGSLAGGLSFADGRGHIVVGGEYGKNEGTGLVNDLRAWGRANVASVAFGANRAANLPANLIAGNVLWGTLTPGGLIANSAANPAALRNLQFVAGAGGAVTTAPFDVGLYQGQIGTRMVGGTNAADYQVLRAATERYSAAANATFALTDSIEMWARGLYAQLNSENISAQIRAAQPGGTSNFLSISRNNPYLQAALTPAQLALIPANGSLTIGYLGNDFGPPVIDTDSETYSVAGGFRGDGPGTWQWDLGVQYGRNKTIQDQSNTAITANFLNAINAVTLNGQTVCASQTARDAGCQPINILGRAAYSDAAYNYAFGTAHSEAVSTLLEASANASGELGNLWAGPVSAGFGFEYREETFVTAVDPISQAGAFNARAPRDFPKAGVSVTEAYVETIIPLLSEDWFTGSLEFNGAARATDYSTSGDVATWKAGLVWRPISAIMVRGTMSRDIRAPSLTELYTAAVTVVPRPVFADTRAAFAGQPSYQYDSVTGGNPGLKPEIGRTDSFGVVFTPGFLPGFNVSADYFDIRVNQAIGATGAATALTNCIGNGQVDVASPYCGLITFANNDPLAGRVLSVLSQNANFAQFQTRGIDFALNYVLPVTDFLSGEEARITLSSQATHVMEYRSTFDVSRTFPNGVNRAGQSGTIFGGTAGIPSWIANTVLAYRGSRLSANVQYRWISKGHFNNQFVGPDDPTYSPTLFNSISDNIVPARGYVNIGASYNLGSDERKIELYGTVNNLLNQAPPLPASGGGNAYYDLLGQTWRLGVRFEM